MINHLQCYTKYKRSGLEWLGEIPQHWSVRRGKSLFRSIDKRSTTGDEELLTVSSNLGVVPRRSATVTMFKAESYVGYKLCWPGDLVINSLWAWARGLGVSRYHGIISTAYGVYRPVEDMDAGFAHELVRSTPFNWELKVRSKGVWTSRLQLTDSSFLSAPFPVPPLDEQRAVVRYLDYMDSRIKRYIRAKQKLINLLEEQKQAIIHQAVTRGLDPNVRLKPSGVEWLGDVPEHWEVKRLKWVTKLQRGYDLPTEQRVQGPFPVVSSGGVIDRHQFFKSKGPGVVMGRYGSTDAVFLLEEDFWPHNTSLFVTDFQGNDVKWCYYMLRSISKADHAGKSAIPGVDRKDLFQIMVAVPPVNEQKTIVSILELRLELFERGIRDTKQVIAYNQEYRRRLFADIITGKLDIRDVAKRLPVEKDDIGSLIESDEMMMDDVVEISELDGIIEEEVDR